MLFSDRVMAKWHGYTVYKMEDEIKFTMYWNVFENITIPVHRNIKYIFFHVAQYFTRPYGQYVH